jgi:two-component system LytT family response regulator
MIKTLIVDDEQHAREFLEKMLQRYFPYKFLVCESCESIDEAVKALDENKFDLVFLDIQMPNKNGFELLKEVKEVNFDVIFTTAHEEYAINAIKKGAIDYLLKPINYIDLLGAFNRLEQKKHKELQKNQLNLQFENIDSGENLYKKIAITTETSIEFIKLNSIIYLEAQSNYTKFYLTNQVSLITSKTLKYFEENLPNNLFFRTHKSYLVNMNFIKRFSKGNDLLIELTTGQKLPVSIRKKDEFIKTISQKIIT